MKNIRASERKRKELEALLEREGTGAMEEFHRLSQEKVYQEAMEAEVDAFLGRSWHERKKESQPGYRNGYYERKAVVPGERLSISVPRLRGTKRPFVSRVLKGMAQLAEKVRVLALEAYIRGLSTRDIEQTFVDEHQRGLLSRSAVSRLSERLYQAYESFSRRDLSGLDVVVLFADGVYEAVRRYTNNQALLCAWGICSDGKKMLIHLAAVQSESEQAWESFFEDLQKRGLRHPLLVVSDGNNGVIAAIERKFPLSDRQRCLVHKLRNIAAKLPRDVQEVVLQEFKEVYYANSRETANLLGARLIEKYAATYPAAVACFTDDLEACLVYLTYPEAHRRFIRTTNLLERTFEEEKRRTKILPQHQHERAVVGLVFAVLYRVSQRWQHVTMTAVELAQLRALRTIKSPETNEQGMISYRIAV